MADNTTTQSATLATIPSSTIIATDQIPGTLEHVQKIKLMDGTADSTVVIPGTNANGLLVDVSRVVGNVAVTGTFFQATQPVSGPLTDAQLRAVAVPVSGTFFQATQPVSGTFWQATQPVSGTVTATDPNVYTEAVASPADPLGSAVQLRQRATPVDEGALAGAWVARDGTKYGAAYTQIVTSTGAYVDSFGGGTQFAEDVAHVSGDIGTVSLAKRTDVPVVSSGTDGDYSTLNVDADGRLWTNTGTVRARKLLTATTITASTVETTVIAAVAAESHDVFAFTLTNTSTTSTKVSLRDDTAGAVKMVLQVPPLATVGITLDVNAAIPQTAQNKNWTLQCASSVTSLEATFLYVKVT